MRLPGEGRRKRRRLLWLGGAVLAPVLAGGAVAAQAGIAAAAPAPAGHQPALYVSHAGSSANSDRSCRSAGYSSIAAAAGAAGAGGTVVVCPGTYHEQVVLTKQVTLEGKGATISETGVTPALKVTIPGVGSETIYAAVVIVSSHVTVNGLTISDADGEGILAAGLGHAVTGIDIARDTVKHNDLGGGVPPASPYFECAPTGAVPGDCGEGIHFAGNVADSVIRDSLVTGNSGGILLSDDVGPTDHNVVENNDVTANVSDCGITVPGHNPNALSASGAPQPAVAGVYGNVIRGNTVTGNGTQGAGSGVLLADAAAGTASYDNLVEGNYIAGNGQSGVTMHAHIVAAGKFEDLSGNVVAGNVIGKNNLKGDTLDSPASPTDTATTGVLVYSGGTAVTETIAHNKISDNAIGVWLSKVVTASGLTSNRFSNVGTPVSAGH